MIPIREHNHQAVAKKRDAFSYINAALLMGSLILGILYIGQVNNAAATGYQIKDLQTSIDNLSIANQQLEYRIADDRAMHNVTRRVSILGLTKPDEIRYVTDTAGSVAVAE